MASPVAVTAGSEGTRMRVAKRVEDLPAYLFVEISRKIAAKRAQGIDVITFGIGDPDLPTPPAILQALHTAADDPANHRYPESEGLPELRAAIGAWMQRRFGQTFDPVTEILPLIGAKEGIAHIPLCFIEPGDIALVPDPGYPVYEIGTMFAGGESFRLPLTDENGWLPDYSLVPPAILERSRMLWINYPNNPTGATATPQFFDETVAFAKQHDLVVCHDNAYSDVAYDGYVPPAFLQAAGARDVGVEFFSFSKTFNMTGWRIAWVAGNPDIINALMRVKSNIDSGIPQAIQRMAIAALEGDQAMIAQNNASLQRRRDRVVAALEQIGLRVRAPQASLYVWARVPDGITSADFATRLLEEQAVVVTPGRGYGEYGEGYVRLSLTVPDDQIDEGARRIAALTNG
ncbi:MAG: LL-diaminopimelate aminotransferase [Chloroflexi bacterium]|nr:MAG: LL-diaminopimelate aminotransferase [Chloroflexota bacterium]